MPPDEIHQAGADQVAHAFHVAHDARHQHAGLVGIVVGDRQPADVFLHRAAQFGDQPLRRLRKQSASGRTRSRPGSAVAPSTTPHQRIEQLDLALADDVIDEILRRGGQHQARRRG